MMFYIFKADLIA